MVINNTISRQNSYLSVRNFVLAVAAIVFLWFIFQSVLTLLVLSAITVLVVIGLKKPLWAMVALLVSQLTVTSFMVPLPFVNISLRLLLLVVTLFILTGALLRREVKLGPGAMKLIVPIIVLIAITTISNSVNAVGFDFLFKEFRNQLVGLLFVILLPAVVSNLKQFRMLTVISLIVITASAVIGIMQHYNFLGMSAASLNPQFVNLLWRVPGMGESELELAYILSVTVVILLAMSINSGILSKNGKLLIALVILMLATLYFTYTRSALISVVLGGLSVPFFLKNRIKWPIILTISFAVILVLESANVSSGAYLSGRSESGQEDSSVARLILRQATLAIALDNPIFGIGGNKFIEKSPQYTDRVAPSLIRYEEDRYWAYRTLGSDAPHNDFLKVWAYYGTFALITYIWLQFAILYVCWNTFRKSKKRFIKGLAAGLAASLVTYVINAYYHNTEATLPLLWIIAGFALATSKIGAQEQTVLDTNLAK